MEEVHLSNHIEHKQKKGFNKSLSLLVLGGLLAVSLLTVALVKQSQDIRQRAQVATTTFLETFDGVPTSPARYDSSRFEFILGHMWTGNTDGPLVVNTAQHGPDCGKPGIGGTIRHSTSDYKDLIFQCRDHMMTHVSGDAAFIYMTPNHSLDLSSGSTATVKWDVSTTSLSTRDWISVFIQNWDTQQQKVVDAPIPGQQGDPRNAIQIEQGGVGPGFESGSGAWHIDYYNADSQYHGIDMGCCGPSFKDVTPMSAETRITFQADITNKRHIRLWLPQFNYTLVEGDLPETLNWSKATVTFGHHSYSADKGANPFTGACCEVGDGEANTWHWDNLYLSPAIPFTIIKADHRSSRDGDTFNFASPAPANSLIRFHAFSGDGNVRVSLNDGPLQNATRTSNFLYAEQSASYIINIPQGTTKARFVTTGGNCCQEVMNPTIFSLTNSGTTPIPTPQVTNTPTPTGGQTFTVNLSGSQEVPPTNSSATGTATVNLNTTNNTLSYTINYSGLSSSETAAHIHGFAASGVGGAGVLHTLPTSNPKVGTWTYQESQEANILAGLSYFNIHTSNFPNGEIRGQIVPPGVATPTPIVSTPTPTRTPTPTVANNTPTPTLSNGKTGDLNKDGQVGILDLSILLSNWNSSNAVADINTDGSVGILDLSILLSNWGL